MSVCRRVSLTVLSGALLAVAGCGGSDSDQAAVDGRIVDAAGVDQHRAESPGRTTAAGWGPVTETLGRTGTLVGGTVYRIRLPRTDLTVVSKGVEIKPGLCLTGHATFARYHDGTMLVGDLVVTEAELPAVTDALQANGIAQTALHKHLLQQHPPIWWTHIHAMGDPVELARGLKAALDRTDIPPASKSPARQRRINLDTAGIDHAIGRRGNADDGIYNFSIPRENTIDDGRHILPPALGLTTVINFQPLGHGRAAINGDFVLIASEVQKVIRALRRGGISIVELHSHGLDEHPRLFYMHYWATGDGETLATALRPALDATDLMRPAP